MRGVSLVRSLYHRALPARVRNPFGMARRKLHDRLLRVLSPAPLPPVSLLRNIQLTPFVSEYLRIGRRSAVALEAAILRSGLKGEARVLDFGCGSARTLRHLRKSGWILHGCDIDTEAIAWARRALPDVDLRVTGEHPPLPWPDGTFDAIWAVSVFTHLSGRAQQEWFAELARVLRPGGVLLISTMGISVIGAFADHDTQSNRSQLAAEGHLFRTRPGDFNDQAAFHTPAGIRALAAPWFDLEEWAEQGLDGFQDLSVLRRR